MARAVIVVAVGSVFVVGLGAGAAWWLRSHPITPASGLAPTAQASTLPSPFADDLDDSDAGRAHAKHLREAGMPPDDLVRGEILSAMDRVKPRVANCFNLFNQPGLATVKLTVNSSGRVAGAHVLGALEGTPTAECVETAARTASFRSFKRPSVTLTWPFVLKADDDE